MKEKIESLKAAFPHTIPVFTGFTFLGIAYGILMNSKGYGVGWTALMSLIVFTGASQYLAITFLTTAFNPLYALLMTIMVSARHLFYGISLLDKFKGTGALKPYLIFGLCDETFSIVHSSEPPEGVDRNWFMFFITALNHFYWVAGSALGAFLGSMVSFSIEGLDFVLTALFVVTFVEQWKSQENHMPAVIGVACSALSLLAFGKDGFIIPAMISILVSLTLARGKKDKAASESGVLEEGIE